MKELPVASQKQVSGGFALPFIIKLIAVSGAVNVARVIRSHYSVTRSR